MWNPDKSFSLEHLQTLTRRQEKLLVTWLNALQAACAKEEITESLKEAPLGRTFVSLEEAGQARDEEALLANIQQQFHRWQEHRKLKKELSQMWQS